MSGELQTQSRKRRDKKKKKECDSDRLDVPQRLLHDTNDDDSSCKEDLDDHGKDGKGISHHESSVGLLSTVVFFFLLGGLVVLTTLIFIELKDSKDVGPTITESRYANILGDLVDEHPYEDEDHADSHPDNTDNDDIFTTSHYDDDLTEGNYLTEDDVAVEDVVTTTGESLIHELFDLLHLSSESHNLTADEEALSKENEIEPVELLVEESNPEILNKLDDDREPNDFETAHTEAEMDNDDVKEEDFLQEDSQDDSSDVPQLYNDHTEQSEIEHTEGNSDEFQEESHVLPSDNQTPSTEERVADVSDEFQEESHILPSDSQTPSTEERVADVSDEFQEDSQILPTYSDTQMPLTEENVNPESLTSDINIEEINQQEMDMTNAIEKEDESIEPEETQEEPAETEENVAEEPSLNSGQSYEHADIANQYDDDLREKLDAAEEELTKEPSFL